MPDYGEVLDARAAEAADTPAGPSVQRLMALLRESQRGAAVLTDLLGSPAWDVFRSNLKGYLDPAEAERALLREQIEAGQVVGDERERADLRLQYLRGLILGLTLALDLPKQFISRHETLDALAADPSDPPPGPGPVADRPSKPPMMTASAPSERSVKSLATGETTAQGPSSPVVASER